MTGKKKIKLKDVTADNWEAVADLELTEEQEDLLDENVYSIAESKFNPHAVLRAVYAGRKLVGFLMYDPCVDEGLPHDYKIYRFMIDRRHQGQGYGRGALECAIEEIRQDADWQKIVICYMAGNKAAKKFYASLGFIETGVDEDGEIIAEIRRNA